MEQGLVPSYSRQYYDIPHTHACIKCTAIPQAVPWLLFRLTDTSLPAKHAQCGIILDSRVHTAKVPMHMPILTGYYSYLSTDPSPDVVIALKLGN